MKSFGLQPAKVKEIELSGVPHKAVNNENLTFALLPNNSISVAKVRTTYDTTKQKTKTSLAEKKKCGKILRGDIKELYLQEELKTNETGQ